MLYQVTLPRGACFGITVKGNHIADAAPIGRWMVGKSFVYVCEWIAKKHGTLEMLKGEPSNGT